MGSHLFSNYARFDVAFTHGQGCYLYNTDQRPYLDFASGIAVSALGHQHPRLCHALKNQIDQFLHFTGSTSAEVAHALVENSTMPDHPGFQDFGEMVLRSDNGHSYVRVDWFTPGGLPTWGDGRLFIQGTEGHIELRKYTDIGRPHKTNSLFLVNGEENSLIDCDHVGLPYFPRLVADVEDRSETAVSQTHTFTTMELAIQAQMKAEQ